MALNISGAAIRNPIPPIVLFVVLTVYSFIKKWSLIPVLGVLCCAYLLIEIPENSWYVFFGWMTLGLIIYFSYGFFKSKLN